MQILNAFTVDVEDYHRVSAFEKHVRRDEWDRWESRVEHNTQRMLQFALDRHDVRGTFFVLGWVARRFPRLVREIHACGHEVGSHGYWHRLIYELSPGEFREDSAAASRARWKMPSARGDSHRAASFSITARSLWALDILVEEGFSVNSSIFPVQHDRYGIPRMGAAVAPLDHARRGSLGVSTVGGPAGPHQPARRRGRVFSAFSTLFWTQYFLRPQPP